MSEDDLVRRVKALDMKAGRWFEKWSEKVGFVEEPEQNTGEF